ncbi:hypothetical protein F5Y10DRAFT_144415 [Nemania abortiva]|nr:hypothetical protein F5Y10DRAFT_144415 [Nemania abortiva]
MANISLDSQIFFTPSVAMGQQPTGRNVKAQNGGVSVTSSRGLEMRQQDAYHRRGGAAGTAGTSQDDVILISSDNESHHDELPRIEELLLPAKRSITGMVFDATSGASDARESSQTLGGNLSNKSPSSHQQQTQNPEHSLGAPPTLALSRQSSALLAALQAEMDRPIPADSAACEEEQAPILEDIAGGKSTGEVLHATPSGVEFQHVPSSGRLTSPPLGLESGTHRESTLRRDCEVESESNNKTSPLPVKPTFLPRKAAPHCGIPPLNATVVDCDEEDDVEVMEQPNSRDGPLRHSGRRPRAEDENVYHPLKGNEQEQNEELDNIRLLSSKRRKTSSRTQPTLLRRSTRQQTHSDRGAFRLRQARASGPCQKRSSRYITPSPPSSQNPGDGVGLVQVPMASFEEWPLQNAVLRQVLVDGMATFQIQFTRDSCSNHMRKDSATGNRPKSPGKTCRPTKRGAVTKLAFTLEEDDLLIKLKKRELSWKEIHLQFAEAFPRQERSVGSLQVRYCTKLKERQSSDGSG